jgi:putative DNA primase/helicase
VWDGYLPRGTVSLLGAHGGTGKSTIALMLGVCAALGKPLFGIRTTMCKTLFVSLEDGQHIIRHRLAHICKTWAIDPEQLRERLHIVDGTAHPELYAAETRGAGETTPSYLELRERAQADGIGLVVVDNASDAFGGDEIQRRQVRAFMRAMASVARLTDCAVLLLAHVDKNTSRNKSAQGGEGYSGSTAWHNSARSRLFMTRTDDGLLTLDHQKSNLGKLREPLTLNWLDGGLPILDAPDASGVTARMNGRSDDECAAALLKLITEFESRQQYCSPAVQARNNVHSMLRSEPTFLSLKLRPDGTRRIVNQCQRAKWLEPIDYRSFDRKPRQRWTVTTAGRAFAGLPALTAPTAPTCHEGADGAQSSIRGAPTAPTYAGGVGGECAHIDLDVGAAVEVANAPDVDLEATL